MCVCVCVCVCVCRFGLDVIFCLQVNVVGSKDGEFEEFEEPYVKRLAKQLLHRSSDPKESMYGFIRLQNRVYIASPPPPPRVCDMVK